ncbi:MAG: rubrerythrin family protein [Bacteroidetes bacterium]|nr:rubrerythrin family protein [Bacteroidota bacterium]
MKARAIIAVLVAIVFLSQNAFAKVPATTINNIKAAIKGETTASAKYAAYAKKAKDEGLTKVALLFQAASKAEAIHANNHRAVLEQLGVSMEKFKPEFKVNSTKENLQDAINGETYEVTSMYPEFLKSAQDENVTLALISFNYAYQTEKKHQAMYKNALDQVNNGKEKMLSAKYMVCTTCGNTYDGEAPARCGISMTPKERFVTIQ